MNDKPTKTSEKPTNTSEKQEKSMKTATTLATIIGVSVCYCTTIIIFANCNRDFDLKYGKLSLTIKAPNTNVALIPA